IRHRNVLALIDAAQSRMDFGSTDVWSLFHSFSFDVSVWEMWGPLLTGARIVLVPQDARLDPHTFVTFLAHARVTMLNIVPSVFRHLVATGRGPQSELAVRQVVFAGEAVDPVAVSTWLSTLPDRRRPAVANMYGITESTVHVTLRQMTDIDFTRTGPGTLIGTPLPHVRMRLVDQQLRPVKPGDVGEILLDGPGVSEGYLGRPELNRERFPTLTTDGPAEHCFRTGDLASWDQTTGSYVYRGRIDNQIQLHGHRIELGEVETALRACPGVFDAAVVLHRPPGRDASLLAHVVTTPPADDPEHTRRTIREIRRNLTSILPRHMIPQHIRLVADLPRTESGKTDRGALVPRSQQANR
ncbi:AMP-binding protein, partial [Actinophytocola gossypii]